jgi:hypothetical protein
MAAHQVLARILGLDPEQDHVEIVFLSECYEFPFDTTRALEFALFRTYAVPSIAALLDRTGEFQHRAQKRYDDTDLLLSEIAEHGYASERGQAAIARINQIHGRFAITNADFLYVLSTLIFEPIRWNARFGWRPMVAQEKLAAFYFWREVGRRMQIADLPDSYEAFEAYNRHYERAHFGQTPSSRRVARATRAMFLDWFLPRRLHGLGGPLLHALMDDPLREAFGFPPAPRALRWLAVGALQLRARVVRWLPERRRPRLRTQMRHRTYLGGYRIGELGPAGVAPGTRPGRDE